MEYGKRKPLMARKPSVVVAIGEKLDKKPPMPEAQADGEAGGGLTCPKCGMELADTPENQEYAASRAEEVEADEDE